MRITKITKSEYMKWLMHPRIIILGCVLILMYVMVLQPLKERVIKIGEPLNLLESYIGVYNSPAFLAFLPIVFLVLMSDFPKMDCNMVFLLHRCGRRQWIFGQLLFLALADITVIFFIFLGLTLPVSAQAFWYNGWSDVVTEAVQNLNNDHFIEELIPANLYFQLSPFQVAVRSTILIFLYNYLLGSIMMLGKFLGKKISGLIFSSLLVVMGAAASYFELPVMWILPAAHAVVSKHYTTYYREMYCSMKTSYWYFIVFIAAVVIMAYLKGRNLSFTKITDID